MDSILNKQNPFNITSTYYADRFDFCPNFAVAESGYIGNREAARWVKARLRKDFALSPASRIISAGSRF
jgi:hypothetical protein